MFRSENLDRGEFGLERLAIRDDFVHPVGRSRYRSQNRKMSMERSLRVSVDRSTWPNGPNYRTFPASFGTAPQIWDVNIPALLLMIGFLTTPSHASGVSLSEFWAWVRYLHAVSFDPELRLSRAFFELDAHQK